MTGKAKKAPPRKRTPAPAPEKTVADEAITPDDPETPYYDARDEEGRFAREDSTVADPQDVAPAAPDKGMCDNHPDRPAALVTNFRWTPPQRFCGQCIPANYRYLL